MVASEQQKEYFKEYYLANKERWAKYRKAPKTEAQKLQAKLNKQKWKENHPEIYLLSEVRYRATKKQIPFNLTLDDIVIPKECPYLGLTLTSRKGQKYPDNLMSVDRIDPNQGYIKGNIEVISLKANRMKNNATRKELIFFAKRVLERYG